MNQLQEIFLEELRDIYGAENELTKALPKMAKAAQAQELRDAFSAHLAETQKHVARLKEIFEMTGRDPDAKKCMGMEGLIDESDEVISRNKDTVGLDAALICAAQKVEHYEMAAYGSLRSWARLIDNEHAVSLLQETLAEEEADDEKLNQIAERSNRNAVETPA